ncbi:MAG TPA: hypothetical protein VFD52_04670 [Clostridia bacterium]|nr:hypothetical protein [Clostridia bacterium]
MIRVSQIKIPLEGGHEELLTAVAKALKCPKRSIKSLKIAKKSIDSRKKDNIFFVYNVDVEVDADEQSILSRCNNLKVTLVENYEFKPPEMRRNSQFKPVVVGFGPAGMFAALTLAQEGLKPIILERGNDVDTRLNDVKGFWQNRKLNTESNIQFGEGGAGTFSDGKLTTGIKNKLCRKVFIEFEAHGAPNEILYSSKPHIGTDKLSQIVKNIRNEIISLGGEVLFGCKMTNIIVANGVIHGISYIKNDTQIDLETDAVILSVGHSARDTVEMLFNKGIKMIQKPFSVGARIEHPREMIDKAQYGAFANHPSLGAADYKLACHPEHGRGAYTFCMCPGGTVVCASSEEGGVVVNGMSTWARDGENSNSALLVGIDPENFPSDHVLAGIELQRQIEQKAFKYGGCDYTVPAQLVGDFINEKPSIKLGGVKPSCPTGVKMGNIREILPKKVVDTMTYALGKMDNILKGFAMSEAVLTAPETRSSSPVRIVRDEFCQSNVRGLFPCGEGAGYAGGIVSAAVDGIRCAFAVMKDEK